MASSTANGEDDGPEQEIRLVNSGELWVAMDIETDVASQGETREARDFDAFCERINRRR